MKSPSFPSFRALGLAASAALLSLAAPASGQLLVTEIQSNQSGTALAGAGDYWELTNFGASTVSLANYRWNDNNGGTGFSAGVVLPADLEIAPGESIIFTGVVPATFRSWWGIPESVKVINGTGTVPGLGQSEGIALYNASGTLQLFLSYAVNGFVKSDGENSTGGHAGSSAGATSNFFALVFDPNAPSTPASPRYTFAVAGEKGAFQAATGTDVGSPGVTGYTPPAVDLTLTIDPASFLESASNPAAIGTVSRSGSTASELVVDLASSDFTEATVPATVTIPAGESSATFDVTAVDDSFPDGDQLVTITASGIGVNGDTFEVTVQDDGDVYSGKLLVTEIQSNQSAAGKADWWELTNFGGEAVDLSDHRWSDDARNFFTAGAWAVPPGTSIAPGESIVFTTLDPTVFRAWWGIAESVQVIQSPGAPGLGQGDAIAFFDDGANELAFLSYAADDFTRSNGDPSTGGHAGISGGGDQTYQSLVWDPDSTFEAPRYTFADGTTKGTFTATEGADTGSPGFSGLVIAPPFSRPDISVGPTPSRQTGANAFGSVASQSTTLLSRQARPVSGYAVVANRGTLSEAIRVRASRGSGLFKTIYRVGSANITSAAVAGSYQTPVIDATSPPVTIRASVTPQKKKLIKRKGKKRVTVRRTYTSVIQATSSGNPSLGDSARIRVQTR